MQKMAAELKLPLLEVTEMTMTVVDGRKMTSMHVCPGFTWLIQYHKFTFDLRILEMESFDTPWKAI